MEKILTSDEVAQLVDVLANGNKEKFGRLAGVTGVTVKRWMKGSSEPTDNKKAMLRQWLDKIEKNVPIESIVREPEGEYAVKKNRSEKYSEVLGQSKPYNQQGKTALEIAIEQYGLLSPERREKVDVLFMAEVMRLKHEQDRNINLIEEEVE